MFFCISKKKTYICIRKRINPKNIKHYEYDKYNKSQVIIMYLFFLLPLSAWGQELVRTVHIPKTEVPFDILTSIR